MDYNITYRQKDKGIQVIISYKDDLGKWKQKSKQGFTNTREGKKKAKYWADETIQELKSTISLDSTLKDITFKEFTDIYLDYLRLRREPKTVNAYKIAINKFEKLNNIPVNKISKLNIQTCVDDMLSHSLMKSTIKIYVNKLKTIFNACTTNYNIIKTNPVSGIDIGIDKIKKEKTALTKSQLDDLLNKLSKLSSSKQIYFIAALLAIMSAIACSKSDTASEIMDHTVSVSVTFDMRYVGDQPPAGMTLYLYPLDENLETRRFDFKGITGGKVDIKPGRYNIICYNNDTHGVDFRNTDRYDSHEAYTRQALPS